MTLPAIDSENEVVKMLLEENNDLRLQVSNLRLANHDKDQAIHYLKEVIRYAGTAHVEEIDDDDLPVKLHSKMGSYRHITGYIQARHKELSLSQRKPHEAK